MLEFIIFCDQGKKNNRRKKGKTEYLTDTFLVESMKIGKAIIKYLSQFPLAIGWRKQARKGCRTISANKMFLGNF